MFYIFIVYHVCVHSPLMLIAFGCNVCIVICCVTTIYVCAVVIFFSYLFTNSSKCAKVQNCARWSQNKERARKDKSSSNGQISVHEQSIRCHNICTSFLSEKFFKSRMEEQSLHSNSHSPRRQFSLKNLYLNQKLVSVVAAGDLLSAAV